MLFLGQACAQHAGGWTRARRSTAPLATPPQILRAGACLHAFHLLKVSMPNTHQGSSFCFFLEHSCDMSLLWFNLPGKLHVMY